MTGFVEDDTAGFRAVKAAVVVEGFGPATQNGELLVTQKTSRQHVVTPRLLGKFEKDGDPPEGEGLDFGLI